MTTPCWDEEPDVKSHDARLVSRGYRCRNDKGKETWLWKGDILLARTMTFRSTGVAAKEDHEVINQFHVLDRTDRNQQRCSQSQGLKESEDM